MLPRISKIKCMMFLPLIRLEGPKLKISAANIYELKYSTGKKIKALFLDTKSFKSRREHYPL